MLHAVVRERERIAEGKRKSSSWNFFCLNCELREMKLFFNSEEKYGGYLSVEGLVKFLVITRKLKKI